MVAAGCGSSSSSTSKSAAAAAPVSSTSGGSGPYGAAASGTATSTPPAGALTITTKSSNLGTILAAGPKRLTVYLFEADKATSSSCSGKCAVVWPPVIGKPKAAGQAQAADLGTITRSDGTIQVTYKGHPLYYFVKDKDDGDAYGQGINSFGAPWYVLAPTGAMIDKS